MAVVVVNEIQGGSQELYEKVNEKAMPGGKLPDGGQVHIAGPIEGGWRVITVWDSEDHFNKFREETLLPALKEAGEGDRIEPSIQTGEVFRLVTA